MIAQVLRPGHEIGQHFPAVTLRLKRAAVIVITGITAEWVERIRRKGDIAGLCRAPGDILDMRVQAPVFVHDQNAGQHGAACGAHEIAGHFACPLGRTVGDHFGIKPAIALRRLLFRIVGHDASRERSDT